MLEIAILIFLGACFVLLTLDSVSTFLEKISTINKVSFKFSLSLILSMISLPYNVILSISFIIPASLYILELIEMIK